MSEITEFLRQINQADGNATEQLFSTVYRELKQLAAAKLAAERPDHTLQPTCLVHEAYLRLKSAGQQAQWENRAHFFAAAAESMRRILIDWARHKAAQRRGGMLQRRGAEYLDEAAKSPCDPDLLLDIEEALKKLAAEDSDAAEFAQLRLFAGLSVSEAGEILGVSRTVAYETWAFIRSWFAVHYGETYSA